MAEFLPWILGVPCWILDIGFLISGLPANHADTEVVVAHS